MTSKKFDLQEKVAIITGASRGIGKAIALEYVASGAKVVLVSRAQETLDEVKQEIEELGGEALAIATHMGELDQIEKMVNQVIETYGKIDIIVNNAGTNPHFGPILTAEESHWEKTFDINVMGYFRLVKAVAPHMINNGGGKIINMSSVAGKRPQPGMGVYCVSKAGVIMLTETLAVELAGKNIQVNCIAPGFIKTKFSKVLWTTEHINKAITGVTPLGRIASPEEVTGIAVYLASDASSFTTGSTFVVDGGLLVNAGIDL